MGIMLLAPQALFPALAPLRIALLMAGVAAVAHVVGCLTSGRPISLVTREMSIAAGLVGWATLTIPLSYWPGGSVDTLTGLFLKSLMLFWLIANTITTVRRFRQFAWGITLMSVPIATTAVRDYLSGNVMQSSERIAGYDAPLTDNPNDLALTLNLILPFILLAVRSSRSCVIRVLALGIAVLNVAAVLLTFSRTGFIALLTILVGIFSGLFRSRNLAWGVALLVALLASLPFLPSALWERWATITDVESDPTGSAQARRDQWGSALRFIVTHPVVGTGIGTGVLGLREHGSESWSEVHNAYLQYGVELGLPGLGLYLLLVVASLRSASSGRQQAGMSHDAEGAAQLAQATRLSLVAFLAAAFFHPVAYHFYFYFLVGLAVAASRLVAEAFEAENRTQ